MDFDLEAVRNPKNPASFLRGYASTWYGSDEMVVPNSR